MNAISSIPPEVTGSAASTASSGTSLGQEGFLKLMIAELQSQNPMQPANNNEYINQLATFTQMEQMTNLANAGELSGGMAMIGHKVTYKGASGSETGTVESIQRTSSGTTLTISGKSGIAETSVTEVK